MNEIKPIEEFVEKWKRHPDMKPIPELTYESCKMLISEALAEGETFADMKPFIRGVNQHFHLVPDLECRK